MTIAQGRHGIKQPPKHQTLPEHAEKMMEWITARGGLALWSSVNLSNPGATWTTPLNDEQGNPVRKPTWQVGEQPYRVITDAAEVEVTIPREVRRMNVSVRMGAQGTMMKLTDASSARLRKAVQRAADRTADKQAWYQFDYLHQQAVIYVNDKVLPLTEYLAGRKPAESETVTHDESGSNPTTE